MIQEEVIIFAANSVIQEVLVIYNLFLDVVPTNIEAPVVSLYEAE